MSVFQNFYQPQYVYMVYYPLNEHQSKVQGLNFGWDFTPNLLSLPEVPQITFDGTTELKSR
jgi:hypothetical protein